MIALDTSSVIAFLGDGQGDDIEQVEAALEQKQAVFPPVVLAELLSDPKLPPDLEAIILEIPLLSLEPDYWHRTGKLRAKLLGKGFKARLADCLIAQNCLEQEIPLITRDSDFKTIAQLTSLRLA